MDSWPTMVESTESTGIYWYYMVLLVIIWDSTKVPELGLQSPSFLMTFLTCSPPSDPWDSRQTESDGPSTPWCCGVATTSDALEICYHQPGQTGLFAPLGTETS